MFTDTDRAMMALALEEARQALAEGEIPVGAVIARGETVVARAHNTRERALDPTGHAEMNALRLAAQKMGGWRLTGCTLYITLEPCCMCAGAITGAQIPRVVYGASDPKMGAGGSLVNLLCLPGCFRPDVTTGILEAECRALLQTFFRSLRERKKQTLRGTGPSASAGTVLTRGEDFEL